jgi:hypothetical protein
MRTAIPDYMARHVAHAADYESACIVCRARLARTGRPVPEYRRRQLAELETRGYVATSASVGGRGSAL